MAGSLAPYNILTNREFEILKLPAQGNKDHEIAALYYVYPPSPLKLITKIF